MEAPTKASPTEEKRIWPFGPTDEAVASFDTSGMFGAFSGVTGEETGGSGFMLEEGPVEGLKGLPKRITGRLAVMIRYVAVAAMIHYFWLMFGNSVTAGIAPSNTDGGHQLDGVARGLLRGNIVDGDGPHLTLVSGCTWLGAQPLLGKASGANGVVSIFDMNNPRLKANNFTLPLQELASDLYSFSLDLTNGKGAPELAMQAASDTTVWHRRLGHFNRKSLDLLKKRDHNGMGFDGTVPDCDICAVRKSHQLVHPKTADHKVKHPFQLVFTDPRGSITPEALGGFMYVSKIPISVTPSR